MTWDAPANVLGEMAIWGGLVLVVVGILKLISLPLATTFELRKAYRRGRGHWTLLDEHPWVTLVIPAYNEGPVLANCVRSLLASDYERLEIIIVDDGSTDDTADVMAGLVQRHPSVRTISQRNAGKAAALNRGIRASTGDVLFFVDADGIFAPGTVSEMLRGFDHPDVGAVCGDDRPVNLNRVQTRLLAMLSHAGTGLVRRALALVGCLPIISGNIGAFPREVIERVGGFDESTVGEDLELTWRVHRSGYRVAFQPTALVSAESPSTLRTLWRQRVRWARGLLQTTRTHRGMIGNPRHGLFGLYLGVNTLTMIVLPLMQLLVMICLPFALATGRITIASSTLSVLGWLGLAVSALVVTYAALLNRAPLDLRHLWTLPLWPIYSTGLAVVMAVALWQEIQGGPASWNKMQRTGDVSGAKGVAVLARTGVPTIDGRPADIAPARRPSASE